MSNQTEYTLDEMCVHISRIGVGVIAKPTKFGALLIQCESYTTVYHPGSDPGPYWDRASKDPLLQSAWADRARWAAYMATKGPRTKAPVVGC